MCIRLLIVLNFVWFISVLSFSGCGRQASVPLASLSASNPVRDPFLFPCFAESGERPFEFSGFLILNQAFLPKKNLEKVFQEAIQEQLRFLTGLWNNDVSQKGTKIFLSARPPEIKILRRQRAIYGLGLALDLASYSGASSYVKTALERGFTKENDPAWKVSYRVKGVFSYCAATPAQSLLASVRLPLDPFLAYWFIKDRRKMEFEGSITATNPCAAPVIARINLPQHYWWVFDPAAKGFDAEGQAFDCRELLKPGGMVEKFTVKIGAEKSWPLERLGGPLLTQKGPIRGTLIFGPTQYLTSAESEVNTAYEALIRANSPASLRMLLEHVRQGEKKFHSEAFRFLSFLSGLDGVVSFHDREVVKEKNHLQLTWIGQFPKGKRELRLRIYFGSTDTIGRNLAEHWPYLIDALAQDDLLLYFGRAGLGLNMSLKQLTEDLRISPVTLRKALQAKRYQLVGIIAPHAYTFFGSDLVEARKKSGTQRTDRILTTTFGEPSLYVGLFSYLDGLFSGDSLKWSDWAAPRMHQDEMLFFSSH